MPSQTDVLNVALAKIGAPRITAIDDGTTNGNYCSIIYPSLLDSLLRTTHWNFATGRTLLALELTSPVFEFTYAYALPSDYLKLREYYDSQGQILLDLFNYDYVLNANLNKFRVESIGDPPASKLVLVSNGTLPMIVYTKRVPNPDLWDALFFQLISTWLASDLASAIAHDDKKASMLRQEAIALLGLASGIDGQEQSIEPYQIPDLLWGR